MRRIVLFLALALLAHPAGAWAHPLGNFTVNRYAEVDLAGDRVFVRYAVDLAEIPTFQERDRIRRPAFVLELARRLEVDLDGRPASLRPLARRLSERPGAGGLPTLRLDVLFEVDRTGTELVLHDRNFAGRIGWREVVVAARDGARIVRSTAPSTSRSARLRAYPEELLESPLDVGSARVTWTPGRGPGAAPTLDDAHGRVREQGAFEALVAQGDLRLGVVLVSLAIAMFWGAAHALTPGHGKAIVAGYLVGSRGKVRHAFLLGGIVTATHTAGVFGLALVTLLLSRFVVPERLYPWLTLASGLLVALVGAAVLRERLRRRGPLYGNPHGHHSHPHRHARADARPHSQRHERNDSVAEPGIRGLLGVGISAGLLPCPSALVVLLSAIALHRFAFGLALIVAFSAGLALTISCIGLVAVLARRAFRTLDLDGPLVRALPTASALLILVVGIGITAKALPEVV